MGGEAPERRRGPRLGADAPAHLGGVVEDGARRHAADELEHVPGPLADALGGLAPQDLGEADVGVREGHRQEVAALHDAPTRKSACPKSTWHSPGAQSSSRNPCASRASRSAASSARLRLT